MLPLDLIHLQIQSDGAFDYFKPFHSFGGGGVLLVLPTVELSPLIGCTGVDGGEAPVGIIIPLLPVFFSFYYGFIINNAAVCS